MSNGDAGVNDLRDLVVKAAEFLCREGRFGTWGDARTSGMAISALVTCGFPESQKDFVAYCLQQLIESDDYIRDDRGSRFNDEVWDTSVGLVALHRGAPGGFSEVKREILKWLFSESQDDNFKEDAWETLWALQALLETEIDLPAHSPFLKGCISWLLNRRTAEGVLISSHYMGFLLSVLRQATGKLQLSSEESRLYTEASQICETYLRAEFLKSRDRGRLWGNEPWMVGRILEGIAVSSRSPQLFLEDGGFNDYLLHWYQNLEWAPVRGGWVDLVDTGATLLGLATYYIERETARLGGTPQTRRDIIHSLASTVHFRFEEPGRRRMTVRPVWNTRGFTTARNTCFVLMPFSPKDWSQRTFRQIDSIVKSCGLSAKRADSDLRQSEIMESIWCSLNECGIVIAECTKGNPNVYYELGIAHTLGKDVIVLTQNAKDVTFDIQRFRYIKYEDNADGYRLLRKKLRQYIGELLKR